MRPFTVGLLVVTVMAVELLAALGSLGKSSAIGPDINDDGVVDLPNDILGVVMAFGQHISTPTTPPTWTPLPTYTPFPTNTFTFTPTVTSTPTPAATPTPTRIPGHLDVEVGLGVSENTIVADDHQPFAITMTMYNHGDNPEARVVSIQLTLISDSGIGFLVLDSSCPSASQYRWKAGQAVDPSGGSGMGMKIQAPGLTENGGAWYMATCTVVGFFTDGTPLEVPPAASDVVTLQATLRDANGNPTTDGNNSNNVAVEVVEIAIP